MIALRAAQSPWIELAELRTPSARVWGAGNRRYCVVRKSAHCFASAGSPLLDRVIDYRLEHVGGYWRPKQSWYPVRVARKGEHVSIGGADFTLLDFGMMREDRWSALLPIRSEQLSITPRCAPHRIAPTWHASYLDGEIAPGVKFHAAISAKGYGKELVFSPLVQKTWFSRLSDAHYFGFRYRVSGHWRDFNGRSTPRLMLEDGWRCLPPRMFVRRRAGQADGFYRVCGDTLYVLFPRYMLDRLLPGEWHVDPAITQESLAANSDDCYEANGTNNLNGYNGRFYAGRYNSPATDFHAGLRFQTVPIPSDATGINSSTIQIFREILNGTPNLTIFGDDKDDVPTWDTGGTERPNGAGVTRTTASVNWTSSFGSNGAYVTLPAITSIVDEIIQRAGWAESNDMRFVLINNAVAGLNDIAANDFSNNSTTEEALFDADYIAGAGDPGGIKIRRRVVRVAPFAPGNPR